MKDNNILKKYNTKTVCDNKITSLFLFLSVIIAISISLAIPQISISIEEYWDKNAYNMNGADLKIEVTYPSEKFNNKISALREQVNIRESKVFNATIKKSGNEVYADLIVGEYSLKKNEAILSTNLSVALGATQGDEIFLFGETYKIKLIEEFAEGVGKQAEEMGYIKVSSFNLSEAEPYTSLLFIDDKKYKSIEQELKEICEGYRYSTVEDVEERLDAENSANMLALNMLNTVSIIMTILSIFSSVILIISKNKKDIAIMRLQSIRIKKIRKSFQSQFKMILYPAILIGTFASIIMAKIILKANKIEFNLTFEVVLKLFFGMLLFVVIYSIYIRIACTAISQIKPIYILRGESHRMGFKRLVTSGIAFTILVLMVYSVYVGSNNVFAGSLIVFGLIALFLIITYLLLRIVLLYKSRNRLYRFTVSSMKEKIHSILMMTLSLSFTILFFLIGFTLSNVIATNYGRELKDHLNYNYMLTVGDHEKVGKILKQTNSTGMYTKLNMHNGIFLVDSEPKDKITLCGVEKNQYYVKYNILKGKDIFEGSSKEVVISDEFAKSKKVDIGEVLSLRFDGVDLKYVVKGIFDSRGMNINHILIDENETNNNEQGIMYLAQIAHNDIISRLDGVQIVALNSVSDALEEGLQNILRIFKYICGICIVLSFIFNMSLVYIDVIEENKNYTIMRAIGLTKKQLVSHLFIKMSIILSLTLFLSAGNYCVIIYYTMRFLFNAENPITLKMLLMPLGLAVLMIGLVFVIPLFRVRNMENYDELRELV